MSIRNIKNKYKTDIKHAYNDLKTKGKRKKQIPNLLTTSRLFAPFLIIPAAASGNLALAGGLTMMFAATDGVDGFLARKWNATSDLGRDLDAFTDKIFAGTLLTSLSFFNPGLLLTLGFEVSIGLINTVDKIRGNEPKTAIIGKVKTAALSTLIVASFAKCFVNIPTSTLGGLFFVTSTLQAATTLTYLKRHIEKETKKYADKCVIPQKDEEASIEKEKEIVKEKVKEKEFITPSNLQCGVEKLKMLREQVLMNKKTTSDSLNEEVIERSFCKHKEKNNRSH